MGSERETEKTRQENRPNDISREVGKTWGQYCEEIELRPVSDEVKSWEGYCEMVVEG